LTSLGVDVDWIDLAQDREKWHAVVKMVLKLWLQNLWGIYGLIEGISYLVIFFDRLFVRFFVPWLVS
jgi:hypothetical protein